MKSRGFNVVIGVLVAVIVVLGALLAFKTFASPADAPSARAAASGEPYPEGSVPDVVVSPKTGDAV